MSPARPPSSVGSGWLEVCVEVVFTSLDRSSLLPCCWVDIAGFQLEIRFVQRCSWVFGNHSCQIFKYSALSGDPRSDSICHPQAVSFVRCSHCVVDPWFKFVFRLELRRGKGCCLRRGCFLLARSGQFSRVVLRLAVGMIILIICGCVVQSFFFTSSLNLLVQCWIISALTPLESSALPLLRWLMASLRSCIVNGLLFLVELFVSCSSCSCVFVVDVQSSS